MRTILQRFTTLRKNVLERLQRANRMTEEGSLGAGNHLKSVVEIAHAHISNLRDLLVGTSDSSLISEHAAHIRKVGAALDVAVAAHAAEVETLAGLAREISISAAEIERTNSSARALSMNARIESARSGAHVFKAIAVEMAELSRAIAKTNSRIRELSLQIERALPRLLAQSQALRTMVSDFISEARSQIDAIDHNVETTRDKVSNAMTASDRALESIIAASYAGLSALQFQDVCAQSLLQIDAWQGEALRASAIEAGVEIDVAADVVAVSKETAMLDHQNAGDLMLF